MGTEGTCLITQSYYQKIKEGRVLLDVLDVSDRDHLLPQPPAESSGSGVDFFPEDDADPPLSDSYSEPSPPLMYPEVIDPSPKLFTPSPDEHNNTDYFSDYVCQVS